MIVDAHAHVYRTAPPSRATDPLTDLLRHIGADAAVIVQPGAEGGTIDWLDQALPPRATEGARLVHGAAVLAATDALGSPLPPAGNRRLLETAADPRVHGLRLSPLHATDWRWTGPEISSTTDLARRYGLVVDLLVHPAQLIDASAWLGDHPNIDVVIDHLGRPDLDPTAATRLLTLAGHANCAVKVSALDAVSARPWPHPDLAPLLTDVLAAFGSTRLMWGSDFPFLQRRRRQHLSTELAEVFPDASAEQLADLAGESAGRWYRLAAPELPSTPER